MDRRPLWPTEATERGVRKYEEYAIVLDYLPQGRQGSSYRMHRSGGVVQVLGEQYFTLLEAALRENTAATIGERLFLGKEPREKVAFILGRISYDDLTNTAQAELIPALEKVVLEQEPRFVEFFNKAQALTPRMHALELLPGIGKRYMWTVIEARERKPFRSFEDITQRTGIREPARLVVRRLFEELSEKEAKYRLFTRGP
ncbi:MAG: DUF655 domain-containing protein [Candidatus Bathyarchaeia archaeon]